MRIALIGGALGRWLLAEREEGGRYGGGERGSTISNQLIAFSESGPHGQKELEARHTVKGRQAREHETPARKRACQTFIAHRHCLDPSSLIPGLAESAVLCGVILSSAPGF